MIRRTIASALLASAVLVGSAGTASAAEIFFTQLQGENERPVLGDLDGTGFATVAAIPELGLVCYQIVVFGIGPATAAHIHEAPEGTGGPGHRWAPGADWRHLERLHRKPGGGRGHRREPGELLRERSQHRIPGRGVAGPAGLTVQALPNAAPRSSPRSRPALEHDAGRCADRLEAHVGRDSKRRRPSWRVEFTCVVRGRAPALRSSPRPRVRPAGSAPPAGR